MICFHQVESFVNIFKCLSLWSKLQKLCFLHVVDYFYQLFGDLFFVMTGIGVRVTNRTGQQLLGANGRDEGTSVSD